MSAIWPLWASAVALLLLAIAALIWPLLRESADAPGERGAADAELRRVYQAQRRELEAEFERQMLAPADREQALEELQRRLLDDTDALQPGGTSRTSPVAERMWMRRGLAGLLAVALPVAALALYLKVGDPQAAATAAAAEPQSHASSGIDVDTMISGLAAKLAQTPDDLEGWVVLARSHEVQEDFAKASDAYRHAIGAAERGQFPAGLQARLHADLADALASDQGGAMEGPVLQALADALRLDPLQPKALALAGAAAVRRGDAGAARHHWQQLLALIEPGTDMALRVQSDLQRLDEMDGTGAKAAPSQAGLRGTVRLSPAMAAHVRQGDTLFVVARAAETGRTPVAVLKLEAGGLPVAFQLDDRHAMSPQLRLSRFKDVMVQAWISRSGLAQRVPGLPTSAAQSAGSTATDVELVIDQLVP